MGDTFHSCSRSEDTKWETLSTLVLVGCTTQGEPALQHHTAVIAAMADRLSPCVTQR